MRHFWLERDGRIWNLTSNSLNDKDDYNFMGEPAGLGVKLKIDTFEIESSIFIENVKHENIDITGKLYFYSYEHFSRFAEFIGYVATTEPMRLYYSTEKVNYIDPNNPQWYKLVLIKELPKAEILPKNGCLVCAVKFASVSHWKKDQAITMQLNPADFEYLGGRHNVAVNIDNTGYLPTPCKIKIEAITDTPYFMILQNDKIIEQGRYKVNIEAGSYMIINSAPEMQEASLYKTIENTTVREDVYKDGERDYTFSNFITIPSGKSLFMLVADNPNFGIVTLSYSLQKELI